MSVQLGAVSTVSTPAAAADAAQQPGATAGPPTADGQAANIHAWLLCPLTKVLFAASARLDSDVRHPTWHVYAHHLFGVIRHGGNASSRLLSARRSWQSAQTLRPLLCVPADGHDGPGAAAGGWAHLRARSNCRVAATKWHVAADTAARRSRVPDAQSCPAEHLGRAGKETLSV